MNLLDATPARGGSSEDELFLLRLRYKEGRLLDASANQPFLISDPATAWLVFSGKLDIFAVAVRDGEAVGARQHLIRLESGQACFGIPTGDTAQATGLLAVGTAGTKVLRVPRARLQEYATMPAYAEAVAALIDGWVTELSRPIAGGLPPKSAVRLDPGPVEVLPEESVSANRAVMWVRTDGGQLAFRGQYDLASGPGDAALPLTRITWAEAATRVRGEAMDTAGMFRDDVNWRALDRFHDVAMTCIRERVSERAGEEAEGVARRAAADRRTVNGAFGRLAAVLSPGRVREAVPEGPTDPLYAACRLVGAAAGIEMHPERVRDVPADANQAVATIARVSRVRVREVALVAGWWHRENGPLLAFTRDGRPVAIVRGPKRTYQVIDPVDGESRPLTAQRAAEIDRSGFMFYRPLPDQELSTRAFLRFGTLGARRDLLMILLLGLAGGVLVTLTPIVSGVIFDRVIPNGERDRLLQVVAALLIGAVASMLFELTRGIAVLRFVARMDNSLQSAVWDRLLALPAPFFSRYSSGDLSARALGINAVRQLLTGVAVSAILGVIFSLFNVALLFHYSPRLALVAIVVVAFILAVTLLLSYIQVRQRRPLITRQSALSGLVVQLINGIGKLRVTGAEDRAFAVWARAFADQRRITFRTRITGNQQRVFEAITPVLTSFAIFGMVAWSLNGGLTSGQFIGFNAAYAQFVAAMISMSGAFITVLNVVPYIEQLAPILNEMPEVDQSKEDPGELSGDIEISHVSFRYKADGPLVLNDVSIRIKAGEFVALVGPSGSGKSSIMRLLLRFEIPEAGSIYYDGQDLSGLDVQAVRRQVGVVLQNGRLMPGSILTNIAGTTGHTVDDAWEASRMAGVEQDIHQMPMGMHTNVVMGGATFSGGQRQRMMIARAIVSKPRILFLDEATSALDSRTQEQVSGGLASLQATRVVVAHRLSTIVNADRIYVVRGGRIVQEGTYESLLREPGPFADLAKRQLA